MLRLRGLLFRHLPVLSWLPRYKVKENLLCDVISGVSAGTIQVPQGQSVSLLLCSDPSVYCLMTDASCCSKHAPVYITVREKVIFHEPFFWFYFPFIVIYLTDKKILFSFQAWRLPSWQTSLLSTVSIPLSSPSSLTSSWALLTRWSQVNLDDLSTPISYYDSD